MNTKPIAATADEAARLKKAFPMHAAAIDKGCVRHGAPIVEDVKGKRVVSQKFLVGAPATADSPAIPEAVIPLAVE